MAKYDIYVAKVYYNDVEGDNRYEIKPVIQIKDDPNKENSFAVITHHGVRKNYPGEVTVDNYKECGLHKPSTIRLTQRLNNPVKSKKYIGTLKGLPKREMFIKLHEKHFMQKHKTEDIDDDFTIKSMLQEVTLVD